MVAPRHGRHLGPLSRSLLAWLVTLVAAMVIPGASHAAPPAGGGGAPSGEELKGFVQDALGHDVAQKLRVFVLAAGEQFTVVVSGDLDDIETVRLARQRSKDISIPNVKVIVQVSVRSNETTRQQIETMIQAVLDQFSGLPSTVAPKVQVTRVPHGDKSYTARLTGDMRAPGTTGPEAEQQAVKRAADVVARVNGLDLPGVYITSEIKPAEPQAAPPTTKTFYWPLTFYHVDPTGKGILAGDTKAAADSTDSTGKLIDALNQLYGTKEFKPVTPAGARCLFIKAPQRTAFAILKALAIIDAPWPQVQLDVWTIQIAGTQHRVSEQALMVRESIAKARADLAYTQQWLVDTLRRPKIAGDLRIDGRFQDALDGLGLQRDVDRPLSLRDSLILLAGHQSRGGGDTDWLRNEWTTTIPHSTRPKAKEPVFSRLGAAYLPARRAADLKGIEQLATAYKEFLVQTCDGTNWGSDLGKLRKFRSAIAVADEMMREAVDAYRSDIESMYLTPLLKRLQEQKGVSLAGRARLVVTSSMPASMEPRMEFQVNTTRPKPWGTSFLDSATKLVPDATKDPKEGGDSEGATKPASSNWFAKLFALLPPDQALALAAVLNNDVQPAYTTVAPGISIQACPVVLPDNNSARLTLNCRFGVATTPPELKGRDDVWALPGADGIASHTVTTDTSVGVFDLLDISSFTLTASHPRGPWTTPILGRLPIVGGVFQFPQGEKRSRFESILLVNTVIVPRATSMLGASELPSL